MLCKASQIFFHILILNATYHLAFPSIEDELSSDWTVAMLCLGILGSIDRMTIFLIWDTLIFFYDVKSFEMGNVFEGTISRLPCAAVALLYVSTSSDVRLRIRNSVLSPRPRGTSNVGRATKTYSN